MGFARDGKGSRVDEVELRGMNGAAKGACYGGRTEFSCNPCLRESGIVPSLVVSLDQIVCCYLRRFHALFASWVADANSRQTFR